jgi:hypothetical protein
LGMQVLLFPSESVPKTAPYLAREFTSQLDEIDLVQLPNYRIYLKLMVDGSPSKPFSAITLAPKEKGRAFERIELDKD